MKIRKYYSLGTYSQLRTGRTQTKVGCMTPVELHPHSIRRGGNLEPFILVRANTKKGYEVAELGDSINLEYPNSKTRRGRVGKRIAQTITTSPQQGGSC